MVLAGLLVYSGNRRRRGRIVVPMHTSLACFLHTHAVVLVALVLRIHQVDESSFPRCLESFVSTLVSRLVIFHGLGTGDVTQKAMELD